MLFRQRFVDGIRAGTITVAFRRWTRPTVRTGGTLITQAGQLSIREVSRVVPAAITEADARRAGYDSRDELMAELNRRQEGELYRIELGPLGVDPRIALRQDTALDAEALVSLTNQLRRMDAGSDGAWTMRVLDLIEKRPGVRAGDLCVEARQERDRFKNNVRRLKSLGLTESLEVGYRLSPRGLAVLQELRR